MSSFSNKHRKIWQNLRKIWGLHIFHPARLYYKLAKNWVERSEMNDDLPLFVNFFLPKWMTCQKLIFCVGLYVIKIAWTLRYEKCRLLRKRLCKYPGPRLSTHHLKTQNDAGVTFKNDPSRYHVTDDIKSSTSFYIIQFQVTPILKVQAEIHDICPHFTSHFLMDVLAGRLQYRWSFIKINQSATQPKKDIWRPFFPLTKKRWCLHL